MSENGEPVVNDQLEEYLSFLKGWEETITKREEELGLMNRELDEREARLNVLSTELDGRSKALDQLKKSLDARQSKLAQREQELPIELTKAQTKAIDELRAKLEETRRSELKKIESETSQRRAKLDELEQSLTDAQLQLLDEQKNLEFDRLRLKKLEETLKARQANLDAEVDEKLVERRRSFEVQLQTARAELDQLREELKVSETQLSTYAHFAALYGNTPEILQRKIIGLQTANFRLKEELGKRPGVEVQQECTRLKTERDRLQNALASRREEFARLQEQVVELEALRNENTILRASNETLYDSVTQKDEIIARQDAQIKRLTAADPTPADREKRMESLRASYLGEHAFNAVETEADESLDELAWLDRIDANCKEYGFAIQRRLLHAFHTSIKISNRSPLTMLAGVSGTGKSELPRLYGAFGGFNFINVAVQSNWDSQESLLGFFNSIDNKFDAQPLLRFLFECTERYANNMAIVLLDEMNLSHVEYYFADFLSKLETRRSSSDENLPKIYVNLGAGVEPYGLELKRNVLWCGTINPDETTKTLSDKVLDRGIVINFPRPRRFKDRSDSIMLDEFCRAREITPMSRSLWESWIESRVPFEGKPLERLSEYRRLLEKMNDHLSRVGRAIGHRVWQSIEHYAINYPLVRAERSKSKGALSAELDEAIRIAVEDQIVQKVMPKLRGIDTRGNSRKNCLEPIKAQLHDAGFNLDADFDRACEAGCGEFLWSSAEYVGDDEERH